MKFIRICLVLAAAFAVTAVHGRPPEAARTATVTLASRSIRLGAGEGKLDFSVVFSTAGAGARYFGNGELRPSTARPGFYEAAYTVLDNSGVTPRRVEAGTIFVPIPEADANGDTVPDTADLSAAVNVELSGEAVPNSAFVLTRVTRSTFSILLHREAASDAGFYEMNLLSDTTLSGDYAVLHAEGTVNYRRTDAGALLDFDLSNAVTNAVATSRVLDSNTVRVAAFRLRVSPDRTVRVGPEILSRFGNIYRAEAPFSDGLTETRVADFRAWVLQITDLNDTDATDVPNFSDSLAPYVAAQPRRQIVDEGGTATFSVTVEGAGPFTYEWQQNGHGLSNGAADGSARVLVIPNVTTDDRGSYRVRVTSAAGSVMSDSTSLSFRTPVVPVTH